MYVYRAHMRTSFVFAPLFGFCLALASTGCSKSVEEPQKNTFKPAEAPPLPPGPEKLEVTDEKVGDGPEVKSGDKVAVQYTGTLMNGKEFDSSRGKESPFEFTVGQGAVIKGWDQGVAGMKKGGKRKLVIPSALGYGENGSPPKIPANAGLKFDVELVEIKSDKPDAGAKAAPSGSAKTGAPKPGATAVKANPTK